MTNIGEGPPEMVGFVDLGGIVMVILKIILYFMVTILALEVLAVLYLSAWVRIRQYLCGRKGHKTEHRDVISGVCFEIVCTECGKILFAGPYDPDPDVY